MIAWSWVAAYAVVVGYAIARSVLRTRRSRENVSSGAPPVSVLLLRPCAGDDPWLARALASTAAARTRHDVEVVLSVARADDAAWPAVERAAALLVERGWRARACVAAIDAPNAKCAQLAAVTRGTSATAIIGADADVDLTSVDLDQLIDPLLEDGGPAALYAPPIESAPPIHAADRASQALLDASLHAFALLAGLDGGGFVGKLFAVRSASLSAIGGFEALASYLGEDMELARRLRERGERTAAIAAPARALATGRRWTAVVERYARWLGVIRAQRPGLLLSYPLLFFPSAPIVLLALLEGAPGAAASAVVVRLAVGVAARSASRVSTLRGLGRAVVLSDLLLMMAWGRALTRSTVRWRGRTLRVHRGGRLDALEASALSRSAP